MARSKNLKGALVSHKSLVARKQAEERHKQHKQAKQASIKSTSAERKAAKRAALAKSQLLQAQSPFKPLASPSSSKAAPIDALTPISSKGKAREIIHPNQRPVIPFQKDDTILLIGEANFSFALSLISSPHNHPTHQILATSYDTREVCLQKYPDAEGILGQLEKKGVKVGFEVDATDLKSCWRVVGKGKRWSRVVFNFPHVGAGITDQDRNILSNQTLLLQFLRSVNPLLTDGPSQFPVVYTKKGKKVVQLRGKANNKRKRKGSVDDGDDDDDQEGLEGVGGVSDDESEDHEDDEILEIVEDEEKPLTTVEKELDPPNKEGTILITLLHQPPYTLWDLPKLATRPPAPNSAFSKLLLSSSSQHGSHSKSRPTPRKNDNTTPHPKYRLLRSFQFHPTAYSGYVHRRTIGFKDGVSRDGNEEILGRKGVARTWEFARAPEVEDE